MELPREHFFICTHAVSLSDRGPRAPVDDSWPAARPRRDAQLTPAAWLAQRCAGAQVVGQGLDVAAESRMWWTTGSAISNTRGAYSYVNAGARARASRLRARSTTIVLEKGRKPQITPANRGRWRPRWAAGCAPRAKCSMPRRASSYGWTNSAVAGRWSDAMRESGVECTPKLRSQSRGSAQMRSSANTGHHAGNVARAGVALKWRSARVAAVPIKTLVMCPSDAGQRPFTLECLDKR